MALSCTVAGCVGDAEDHDNLASESERAGWNVTVRALDGSSATRHVSSDPGRDDTDGDGLNDFIEFLEGIDPRDVDTDGDGLLDGYDAVVAADGRAARRFTAAGVVAVADGSALRFLGERGTGDVTRGGLAMDADTDRDGLGDGEEAAGFVVMVAGVARTVTTIVHLSDSDGDGLMDAEERAVGSDPSIQDTDGDGVVDTGDVDPARDIKVRLLVDSIALVGEHEGSVVWMEVYGLDPLGYVSDFVTMDAQAEPHDFDSPVLDPRDDGGSVREGRHNVTFLLSVLKQASDGSTVYLDLVSDNADAVNLAAQVDVMSGAMSILGDGDSPARSTDGGFSGPDGSLRFHVMVMTDL